MSTNKLIGLSMSLVIVAMMLIIASANVDAQPPDTPPGCGGPPVVKDEPVVAYSRKPRDNVVRPWKGLELPGAANWQAARDVGVVYGWLQEEDLVVDDNGKITVVESCTAIDDTWCAATEPAWSPDGVWLSYTYNTGTAHKKVHIWGGPTTDNLWEFMVERSEIRLWNADTGERKVVSSGPWRDWAASWASNTLLVMSSDREAPIPNLAQVTEDGKFHRSYPHKGAQIWRINVDGTGARNLTKHEMLAMNPWVMSNGDVCYSSWQGYGKNSIGHSSPRLDFWIDCMDINGEGTFTDLGAHGYIGGFKTNAYLNGILTGGDGHTGFKSLRPVGELRPGVRTVSLYYRSNSGGDNGTVGAYLQGDAEGVLKQADVQESVYKSTHIGSGRFVKDTFKILTLYGNDQDREPRYEAKPPYRPAGRAGGASPSTNGLYVYQHSRGECYRAAPMDRYKKMQGEPWCGREIREALVERITNPFDPAQSRVIACEGDEYLCMTPRVRMTYRETFGMDSPAIAPIKEPQGTHGLLAVVNLVANELFSVEPNAYDEKWPGQKQNNAVKDYAVFAANGGQFCATYVELHDTTPPGLGFKSVGPKVCEGMARDEEGNTDGSVLLAVECERPFIMTVETPAGIEIARDRKPHTVQCGEVRACHGCHDGHSKSRLAQLGDALDRWVGTLASKQFYEEITQ